MSRRRDHVALASPPASSPARRPPRRAPAGVALRALLLGAACLVPAGCLDVIGGDDRPASALCLTPPDPDLELPCSNEPLRIADDPGFVALTAGEYHTCGLTVDGRIHCWGADLVGELGAGGWPAVVPRPTPLSGDEVFVSIDAGRSHTCAIAADGSARCWGANYAGQLGTGVGGTGSPVPSPVPAAVAGDVVFTQVRAGAHHTCGLDADGAAHCWGMDWFGEVGQGEWTMSARPEPLPVVGEHVFTDVDTGQRVTCALAADGAAWCWGLGSAGELGTAQASVCEDLFMPLTCATVPVRVETGARFTGLATGTSHTCAITTDNGVECWGEPGQGQLGPNGHYGYTPVTLPDTRFARIFAGGATSCGIRDDGTASCWGGNWAGQLGTGTRAFAENQPATVRGGLRFESLAVGYSHTCGLTDTGATYCWGSNQRGQLGHGRR